MKLGHYFAVAGVSLVMTLPAFAETKIIPGTYQIDPAHSKVGFKVKHMMINNVEGDFSKFEGTVVLDQKFEKSKFTAKIDANSISTKNDDRDKHLKSADFFDTAKFPNITFESSSITPKEAGHYEVTGTLVMHGVAKPQKLDLVYNGTAVDGYGNQKIGFEATGKLSRKDFGVSWSKSTDVGPIVSDEVFIDLNIEAGKPLDPKAGSPSDKKADKVDDKKTDKKADDKKPADKKGK